MTYCPLHILARGRRCCLVFTALARGDKERLAAIYRHYDGIYKKMTCVVLGIGSISTIFAVFSVNASISDLEVAVTYLTFMLSVVLYNRQMVRNYFIQAGTSADILWQR